MPELTLPDFPGTPPFRIADIPVREFSDREALCQEPLVSVLMPAYRHENFLRQAVDSVLAQQCDFPFELIIGEDCSPDATREIALEYQRRHPEIIRVVTADRNVGAQWNTMRMLGASRGRYIAYCEGDDYWTDERKLAKQRALMEAHPEYSMCVARALATGKVDGKEIEPYVIGADVGPGPLGTRDLLATYIHTSTYLLRTDVLRRVQPLLERISARDVNILFLFADQGPIGVLEEVVSVHRMTSEGVCSALSVRGKHEFVERSYRNLYRYYIPSRRRLFAGKLLDLSIKVMLLDLRHGRPGLALGEARKALWLTLRHGMFLRAGSTLVSFVWQRLFFRQRGGASR